MNGFTYFPWFQYVNENERSLIDDLIDFGSQIAGKCDYNVIHSLYRFVQIVFR